MVKVGGPMADGIGMERGYMASIYRSSQVTQSAGRFGFGAVLSVTVAVAVTPILVSHRELAGWLSLLIITFGLGLVCGRYATDLGPHVSRWQQSRRARRAQRLNRTTPAG